jgi:hypothetical protein
VAEAKADEKATVAKPTDTVGRWLVALSHFNAGQDEPGIELPAMLVDIAKSDAGKYEANLREVQAEYLPPTLKLKVVEITADSAHLVLQINADVSLDIRGQLSDGRMFGNMMYGRSECDPVRFLPTEATSLNGLEPRSLPGAPEFDKARKSPEPYVELQKFRKDFGNSPMALLAYVRLLDAAKEQKLDRAAVAEIAQDYFRWAKLWGPRMEAKAHLDYAIILTHRRFLLDMALAEFDTLEKQLKGEAAERWKPLVESERTRARTYAAVEALSTGADAEKKQAAEQLLTIEKSDPYNQEVVFALAQYNEKQGQIDDSLRRYAQLAMVPLSEVILQGMWQQQEATYPLPSETVARLWKEKHGNTDGLENFLDEVYRQSLSFPDEKVPPRGPDGGNQVALLEFFTGSECPPCVGADVAVSRLEATYAPTELITLVFQQHIPAPSPLANEDSDIRQAYYFPDQSQRGTPAAALNGKVMGGLGGPFVSQSTAAYQALRKLIDPLLATKTETRILLKATAAQGSIELSADVEGLKDTSQTIRLRTALAEDEVNFVGSNGIRHHAMVVRSMPSGPLGTGIKDGRLSFKKAVSLAELKQQLADYLEAIEQKIEKEFPSKPLDLKKLHFVAFIQNDTTHEVLQAAVIPVTGDLTIPKEAEPGKKKEAPQVDPSQEDATPKESGDKNPPQGDAKK